MEAMLISVDRAAAALSISQRTLWTLTKTGDVQSVRIRGRVLYAPTDLEDYIAAHRTARDSSDAMNKYGENN
jgi:hypothetical protein